MECSEKSTNIIPLLFYISGPFSLFISEKITLFVRLILTKLTKDTIKWRITRTNNTTPKKRRQIFSHDISIQLKNVSLLVLAFKSPAKQIFIIHLCLKVWNAVDIEHKQMNHTLIKYRVLCLLVCFLICLLVWRFTSRSKIFHSYGDVTITDEGVQILIYARYLWPLSSEGSSRYHPFIMVISEVPWHLRTPELEGLAHQFCASWVYVCSEFVEMNQIIINSMKYALCNIHINDYNFR